MPATPSIFQEMGFAIPEERLPEQVVYSLARTANLLTQTLATVYRRVGLTPASFNLLMLLKHGADPEAFTQQAVGARLVSSPANMTGLIDRLEAKGWITRLPGKDRRSHLLQITPKGSMRLDEIWAAHVHAVEQLAQALSRQEARTLVRLTAQVRHAPMR